MPITQRELESVKTLTECKTKIEHLVEKNEDLKQSLLEAKKALEKHIEDSEKKEERLSDRRLAIYLALASILGAAILKGIEIAIAYLA